MNISIERPSFMDTPYFYIDNYGWHIKNNAPAKIKKEFLEFMKGIKTNG